MGVLVKHGTHDQLEHGRWAQGRSANDPVTESIRRADVGRQLDVDEMKIGLPPGHQDSASPQDDLAKIVEAQGWNEPASLLSDEEFAEAYDTGQFTIVYRTGPIGLEQGILNGTPYVGEGLYGMGTYVTDSATGVLGYVRYENGRSVVPMLVPTAMLESAASVEPETAGGIVPPNRYLRDAAAAGDGALSTRKGWGTPPASEYVIYNTSALLVGKPSEFPDKAIPEYIYDKPEEEPLPWERFEKMVEGWEDGPYYALVAGEAVLVEFDEVAKHLDGQHDQSEHGKWADGRGQIPAAEAVLAPSANVDRMYVEAYLDVAFEDPQSEDLEWVDPEEAAPYLKQHVSKGVADRVKTTPEELWALGTIDTSEDRGFTNAQADVVDDRRFGMLLQVVNRDPSTVTAEKFRERVEHFQALGDAAASDGGLLYPKAAVGEKFDDGSWVIDAYEPVLREQFGVDILSMSTEQRGIHIEALSSSITQRVVTPEIMAKAIEDGSAIFVGFRDDVSMIGLPVWSRAYRATGSLTDPAVVRAGVEVVSEKIVDGWAVSSNHKTSVLTQQAAQQEFGLQRTAASAEPKSVSPQEMSLARKVVRAQYEATQELLDRQLGEATHVMLFRGGDSAQRYDGDLSQRTNDALVARLADPSQRTAAPITPLEATLNLRPLASFSTSPRQAAAFLGTADDSMFVAAVPKERILSTATTGLGSAQEYEFVVLGGPIHGIASLGRSQAKEFAEVMDSHVGALSRGRPPSDRNHAASQFPDWNLPMGATEFVMIDGFPVPIGKAVVVKHGDHDQSSHGNWSTGAKADWDGGIPDGASVDEIDEDGLADLYQRAGGVAGEDLEDDIQTMSENAKGALKDSVASAVGLRLEASLTVGELMQTAQALANTGRTVWQKSIKEGDTVYVHVMPSGPVRWSSDEDFLTSTLDSGTIEQVEMGDARSVELLAYQFASESLQSWAMSSQSIGGQLMQRAVHEMFSLDGKYTGGGQTWGEAGKQYGVLVKAMYDLTQEALDKQFPDTDYIRLYRGGDAENRYEFDYDSSKGGAATIDLRPLASFTTNARTAMAFASNPSDDGMGTYDGFTTLVPKSRIFSTAATGLGAADEYEFVVIGGSMRGNPRQADSRIDLEDFIGAEEFITVNGQPIPVGVA